MIKWLCVGFIILMFAGCSTLSVSAVAGDKVHCELSRSGPVPIECTKNGKPLFKLTGPVKLKLACPE